MTDKTITGDQIKLFAVENLVVSFHSIPFMMLNIRFRQSTYYIMYSSRSESVFVDVLNEV